MNLIAKVLGVAAATVSIFAAQFNPLFVAPIAVAFLVMFAITRDLLILTALLAWVAFSVWEVLLQNGTLCDEDCNIRLDLLVLLPALGVLSAAAAGRVMGRRTERL